MCWDCVTKSDFNTKTDFDLVSIRNDKKPLYIRLTKIKCPEHTCCGYDTIYNTINKEYDYKKCTNKVTDNYVCENHSVFSFDIINTDYMDIQLNKLKEIDFKRNRFRNFPTYYTMTYSFYFNKGYYSIKAKEDTGKHIFTGITYFDINCKKFLYDIFYIHDTFWYHTTIVNSEVVFLTQKNITELKLDSKKIPKNIIKEVLNGDIFFDIIIKILSSKIFLIQKIFTKQQIQNKYNYVINMIKNFLKDYKSTNNKVIKFYEVILKKLDDFELDIQKNKIILSEEEIDSTDLIKEELNKLTNYCYIDEFKNN